MAPRDCSYFAATQLVELHSAYESIYVYHFHVKMDTLWIKLGASEVKLNFFEIESSFLQVPLAHKD